MYIDITFINQLLLFFCELLIVYFKLLSTLFFCLFFFLSLSVCVSVSQFFFASCEIFLAVFLKHFSLLVGSDIGHHTNSMPTLYIYIYIYIYILFSLFYFTFSCLSCTLFRAQIISYFHRHQTPWYQE